MTQSTASPTSPDRGALAIAEAELIAKVLDSSETVRIAGLVDKAVIKEHFGDKHVPYRYEVAGKILQGVIVPRKLADSYQSKSKS
jgi:hypothetical protein